VTRFALLAPTERTWSVTGRAEAFVACCRAGDLPVVTIESADQSHAAGHAAADAIEAATRRDGVQGIFCATDLLALGVLDRLRHERGVDIPGALQIVGFDDIAQAGWSAYALSTIRQDVAQQAAAAVDLALARLDAPDRPFETRTIGITTVRRGTTRCGAEA
jgi:DNA-binding LacI/PurR family transcriptional regulator